MYTSPGRTVSVGQGCPVIGRVHVGYSMLVRRVPGCLPSRHISHLRQAPKARLSGALGPSSVSAPPRFSLGHSLRAELPDKN